MTLLDPAALTRSIDEAVALHAPQAKAEPSFWSRVGGALAGAPAGGKEAGAMMADTLKAFGESAATVVEADPFATAIVGRDKVRADADTSRATIARGEAFTSEAGTTWRADARAMRPDPATATIAESIVFDAARVLTKAIGYSVAGGPLLGAAATGVDEGMTEVDRLIAQGVDPETARNAGVVTAVATGASVALPVAGSTLPRTLGLAALGGPATFVAQQATTRAILEDAGYTRQAQAYDPTDPLGLGLSFAIPAIFGAAVHASRAARSPAAATAPAGQPELSPVAQAARDAMAAPAEAPGIGDVLARVTNPEHVDAAMVHNLTLARESLPAKQAEVMTAAAEASRGPVTDTPEFRAWFGESKVVDAQGKPLVVYHGTPAGNIDSFKVSKGGSFGGGIYTTPDAWAASIYANEPVPTGREAAPTVYPVYVSIKNPAPLTEAVSVGNWRGEQAVRDTLMQRGYDGVIDMRGGEIVAFRPEQIKSAIGNSGRFDPNSASLTDQPAPRAAEQAKQPKTASEQAKEATAGAQDAAKAFRESGQSLDEFVGRSSLEPAPRNLLIGLAEAGKNSVRIKRMLDDFARTAEAHPDVPLANVAADVVDASRAGREVTPKQSAEALKADPASDMTAQRVSRVESDTPDLPVTRDADGNTQTAREVMETARREAAEGTDDTLGALDAPLIEVAASCFLTNGA